LFDVLHVSLPKQVDPGQHGWPSDPHASQVPLEQKAWLPWHCAWPWMLQQAVPTCPPVQQGSPVAWVAEASGERERLLFGSDDEADVTRFVEHRLSGRADHRGSFQIE
jgi:hypothetical protein